MRSVETPQMSCNELVDVITDYLEGVLPELDRTRFEDHLANCGGCQAYMEQMRATIDALGHLPPESLSSEAERELLAAFRDWQPG